MIIQLAVNEDASRVFGREFDKQKIIELLFSDCQNNLRVISIVGMKGVGKTTLAQLVYNDEIVSRYFNLRGWVHVLESYDVLQLIKAITESFGRKLDNSKELNTLQEILKEEMWRKRVLLVLNNICNYKNSFLEFLSISFNGAESVKIIVTSSNDSVAAEFEEMILPYHLHCLHEDESWLLFQHCAFDCHGFHQIGRKIVIKCKGLPSLSLKMLGHLLRDETDKVKWIEILESVLWDENKSNIESLTAIKLSYQHLTIYLKPCLTYCSLFPEGYKFTRDKLVMLWMAQGFIQPKRSKAMEDIGSQSFNELLRRSFFEKVDGHDDQLFSMHDLIHETIRAGNISNEVQHLYIDGNTFFSNEHEYLNLQTVIVEEKSCDNSPTLLDFNLLRNLRLLELKSCQIFELPDFIGNLKHLRYLHLECNQIKRLPESVSQLYNPQVLNLHHCVHLEELPERIGNLINLLFFSFCGSQVQSLPQSIIQLHNLQTLKLLHCRSLVQLPKGIGKLTNLRHLKLEQLS